MPLILDQSESSNTLRLSGDLGIATSAELKQLLLDAFALGKQLRIDLKDASGLDVTTLQLLWAADKEAKKSGSRCVFVDPLPVVFSATLEEAALDNFPASVE